MAFPNDYSAGEAVPATELNQIKRSIVYPDLTAGEAITGATTPVPGYIRVSDNRVYMSDANDTSDLRFDGFAISTAAGAGSTIDFQTEGIVSGFTGLTAGAIYYVSDTVGTISTTPGTYTLPVGIALSTTTLLIWKRGRIVSGTGTNQTSTTTQNLDETITIGFKPRMLILMGRLGAQTLNNNPGDNSSFMLGELIHINGVAIYGFTMSNSNYGADIPADPAGGTGRTLTCSPATTLSCQASSGGTATFGTVLSINSISDTGFVIRSAFTAGASVANPNGTTDNIRWIAFE